MIDLNAGMLKAAISPGHAHHVEWAVMEHCKSGIN